ncbi:MAG: hypothetical protein DRG09_03730 [Epsilonproteobacteria bacterium]|nr:MAG: hypothetical protein DRG09_03730 [Campylobacterota bacterium]
MLKPYVKEALEEEIGLPVEVKSFKLEYGTVRLTFVIDGQALVETASHYGVWGFSLDGIYKVTAKKFDYEGLILGEADLKGNFKREGKEIDVTGQGLALGAKIDYSFKIMDDVAQKIILKMKDARLEQILTLLGKPALAHGKVDIDVNMPDIGNGKAEGQGQLLLHQASFDRALVKQLYGYTLPAKSEISAKAEAKLQGNFVGITGEVESDLFSVLLKDTRFDIASKIFMGKYVLDVKELRIVTKNKLTGAFKAQGDMKLEGKQFFVAGKSSSFGGELGFSVGKNAKITLQEISLEKMLPLFRQPVYAKGKVNGTVSMDDISAKSGEYDLYIDKGSLISKTFAQKWGSKIPVKNQFSFTSKGKIDKQKLRANVTLLSTLTELKLSSLSYDLKDKMLISEYDLLLHDVKALLPKSKTKRGETFGAKGKLQFRDTLIISGETKGLGKKVAFRYDSKKHGNKKAELNAPQILVEKVLALMGVPVYIKGTMDAKVIMTDVKAKEGTFSLKGTKLVTQSSAMKKWMGKALKMKVKLESSGTFEKEKVYMTTKLRTPLANIDLNTMVYDQKKKSVKSAYRIDIPELKKLQPYIDKKLYGPIVLKGVFSKEKKLKLTGNTTSLGGKINYSLHGKELRSTITAVPLLNILGLLGHKKFFLGQAYGKGTYNIKQKSGVVDLDIRSFQIKPSSLTQTVKMFLGKDPARIIFSSSKFHADIKKKVTRYTLRAQGSHSSFEILNGSIDKRSDTHKANFTFVYEKYTIHGKIRGSADNPKVTIDTSALLKEQLSNEKVQKKLEKALGSKAAKFLKGLNF